MATFPNAATIDMRGLLGYHDTPLVLLGRPGAREPGPSHDEKRHAADGEEHVLSERVRNRRTPRHGSVPPHDEVVGIVTVDRRLAVDPHT